MSATEILTSLPTLSDEDLRQVAYSLDLVLRERRPPIIDDAYGTLTEEDMVTVVAEAWDELDGGKA